MLAWMDWSGIIVGVLVLLHCGQGRLGRTRTGQAVTLTPWGLALTSLLTWACVVALALYLATVPTKPPFQPGQLLGKGALVGAVLMLLSLLLLIRWREPSEEGTPDRGSLAAAACALVAGNVVFLVWRKAPTEPLLGFGLAATLFGAVVKYGVGGWLGAAPKVGEDDDGGKQGPPHSETPSREAIVDLGEQLAMLAVTVALGVIFSSRHLPGTRELWGLPIALGAVTLLAAVAGEAVEALAGGSRRSLAVAAISGTVVAAGAAAIVAIGAYRQAPGAYAYLAGLVVMGLCAWLVLGHVGVGRDEGDGGLESPPHVDAEGLEGRPNAGDGLRVAVVAGLLSVAVYVIAFRLNAGLGAALALQAAWLVPILTRRHRAEQAGAVLLTPLLGVGMLLLLYRLYLELVPGAREADVAVHYSLVAIALGLLTPFLWQAYNLQTSSVLCGVDGGADTGIEGTVRSIRKLISRLTALGVVVAIAPALLFFLWPQRAVAGFILGLFLAQLVILVRRLEAGVRRDEPRSTLIAAPGLLCLAAALCATPACRLLSGLADTPRLYKAYVAFVVVLLLYLWGHLGGGERGASAAAEEASEQ